MLLYHYTLAANVLRIAGQGLKAAAGEENGFISGGIPVVWLTEQESNIATEADKAAWRFPEELHVGKPMFGGSARLEVRLERHDPRLIRYFKFVRKLRLDLDVSGFLHAKKWWVYRGDIPASEVCTVVPARVAIECLDFHIERHPDAEAREMFKAWRADFATLPPDDTVAFEMLAS
jgi:hypothetical protein